MVVFLLAHVEVGSALRRPNARRTLRSMQSIYRIQNYCAQGSILKIHINQCTNGSCKAKFDGFSTKEREASKCYYNANADCWSDCNIAEENYSKRIKSRLNEYLGWMQGSLDLVFADLEIVLSYTLLCSYDFESKIN